jgi:hypothetical protein
MGGWNYSGEDVTSVQIFTTEREGREYGESLTDPNTGEYDYYELVVREVPSPITR